LYQVLNPETLRDLGGYVQGFVGLFDTVVDHSDRAHIINVARIGVFNSAILYAEKTAQTIAL